MQKPWPGVAHPHAVWGAVWVTQNACEWNARQCASVVHWPHRIPTGAHPHRVSPAVDWKQLHPAVLLQATAGPGQLLAPVAQVPCFDTQVMPTSASFAPHSGHPDCAHALASAAASAHGRLRLALALQSGPQLPVTLNAHQQACVLSGSDRHSMW